MIMITNMVTGMVTGMTTDNVGSTWLPLLRLASPVLPIGGFSYSDGLEAGIDHQWVATESEATHYIRDLLELSLARSDLAAVARALVAWRERRLTDAMAVNTWVLQTRESAELQQQCRQMGRSLLEWLRGVDPAAAQRWDDADAARAMGDTPAVPTYPCAFALAAACTSTASVEAVLTAYSFAWCEGLTQAAIKAVPLGQAAGQRVLAQLMEHIPAVVDAAQRRSASADGVDAWQAFSPGLAILSARHETQYSRLFRS